MSTAVRYILILGSIGDVDVDACSASRYGLRYRDCPGNCKQQATMSTKLYVGNLPDSAKEKDIRELFQSFGEVEEVAILRGYAFVVSTF